jgi:cysteine-rich repeat protein
MNTDNWLVFAFSALLGAQLTACSNEFDSCQSDFSCPSAGASGTDAGLGGTSGSGSNTSGGGGGNAGAAADAGAAGEGIDSAGAAGMTEVVDAGQEPPAVLFGPCSSATAVACTGHAEASRLACDGTEWQLGIACKTGELCDSPTGNCLDEVAECASATPGQIVCRGSDTLLTCGQDLVTATQGQECAGLCSAGVCQTPICGDGKTTPPDEACDDANSVTGDGCFDCTNIQSVSSGSYGCVLLSNGTVKCWGPNAQGQLGIGNTVSHGDASNAMGTQLPTVDLGPGRTVVQLAVGDPFACAILDNATLKCWGYNGDGELGLGDTSNRGDAPGEMGAALPTVDLGTGHSPKMLSAGGAQACAILEDGSVKCWGAGGNLGTGDAHSYGNAANSMGDNLPVVALGTGRTAKAIVSGSTFNCALLDDASVKCWGTEENGELGLGNNATYGADATTVGDGLPTVDLGTNAKATAIVAAYTHTCVILQDGTVKCWGNNMDGELGTGDQKIHGAAAGTMGDNLPAVALGTGRSAVALSVAFNSTCALLDDSTVKCWGSNADGDVGGAGPSDILTPWLLNFGTGRTVKQIANGSVQCALLDDETLKCWGYNMDGELGLGDVRDRGKSPAEMGDNLPTVLLP